MNEAIGHDPDAGVATRQRILTRNPGRLFGFATTAA
jgi:hypothetical protein